MNYLKLSTDNVVDFKKDFITIIRCIGNYIESEDFESLKKYYKGIMQEYKEIKQISLLNSDLINESAIQNILCNKYGEAKQLNIQVDIDIMMNFSKIDIKIYDFVKILGILLDNAIESAKECEEKYIHISFIDRENKSIFKISNTYNPSKGCNMNKIFNKGYSTKKDNTGLGLWEIKQMMFKYTNLNLNTYTNGKIFAQELLINNNHDMEGFKGIEENAKGKKCVISKHVISLIKNQKDKLKENDDIRTLRHDFNNIMQAIGGYIKMNDYKGLGIYYKDLIIDHELLKKSIK